MLSLLAQEDEVPGLCDYGQHKGLLPAVPK